MVSNGDEESSTQIPQNTKISSFFKYNSPLVQVILIAFVCFYCLSMFNAFSRMGGGDQVNHTASNNSLITLYATFAIFGFFGDAIYNIIGPLLTLVVGCFTYVLYTSSFLYYNHQHYQAFAILTDALLSIGAGLFWLTQGAIMTSYSLTNRKGTYISIFWSIFNIGGVIGGLIPFILNYHRSEATFVNDGTRADPRVKLLKLKL